MGGNRAVGDELLARKVLNAAVRRNNDHSQLSPLRIPPRQLAMDNPDTPYMSIEDGFIFTSSRVGSNIERPQPTATVVEPRVSNPSTIEDVAPPTETQAPETTTTPTPDPETSLSPTPSARPSDQSSTSETASGEDGGNSFSSRRAKPEGLLSSTLVIEQLPQPPAAKTTLTESASAVATEVPSEPQPESQSGSQPRPQSVSQPKPQSDSQPEPRTEYQSQLPLATESSTRSVTGGFSTAPSKETEIMVTVTASPTSSTNPQVTMVLSNGQYPSQSLAPGVIAAIVIGVIALVLGLFILLILLLRFVRKDKSGRRYDRTYWGGWDSHERLRSIDGGPRSTWSDGGPRSMWSGPHATLGPEDRHSSRSGGPSLTQDRASSSRTRDGSNSVLLTPFSSWYGEQPFSPAGTGISRSSTISVAMLNSALTHTPSLAHQANSSAEGGTEDREEDLRPSPCESAEALPRPRPTIARHRSTRSDGVKLPMRSSSLKTSHVSLSRYAPPSLAQLPPRSPRPGAGASDVATLGSGSSQPTTPGEPARVRLADGGSADVIPRSPTSPGMRKHNVTLIAPTYQLTRTRSAATSTTTLTPIVEHDRDVGRMRVLLPPLYDPRWTLQISESGSLHSRHSLEDPHMDVIPPVPPIPLQYRRKPANSRASQEDSTYATQLEFFNHFFPPDMTNEEIEERMSRTW